MQCLPPWLYEDTHTFKRLCLHGGCGHTKNKRRHPCCWVFRCREIEMEIENLRTRKFSWYCFFSFHCCFIIIVSFFFRRKGCGILIRFHKSKLVRNKFSIEKTDRVETLSSRKRRVAVPDARWPVHVEQWPIQRCEYWKCWPIVHAVVQRKNLRMA